MVCIGCICLALVPQDNSEGRPLLRPKILVRALRMSWSLRPSYLLYISLERVYAATSNRELVGQKFNISKEEEGRRDGKVTEAMDCFSVGCVSAKLFLEGAPLFALSQLFQYWA